MVFLIVVPAEPGPSVFSGHSNFVVTSCSERKLDAAEATACCTEPQQRDVAIVSLDACGGANGMEQNTLTQTYVARKPVQVSDPALQQALDQRLARTLPALQASKNWRTHAHRAADIFLAKPCVASTAMWSSIAPIAPLRHSSAPNAARSWQQVKGSVPPKRKQATMASSRLQHESSNLDNLVDEIDSGELIRCHLLRKRSWSCQANLMCKAAGEYAQPKQVCWPAAGDQRHLRACKT